MPQSLSVVYLHLIFSTKERRPFLRDKPQRSELHAYLGGISKTLGCPTLQVGGVEDHVHLVARFGRSITQADWVKELKRVSSLWLKERSADLCPFRMAEWLCSLLREPFQVGVGATLHPGAGTASPKNDLPGRTARLALLRKHEVQWDERYLWD